MYLKTSFRILAIALALSCSTYATASEPDQEEIKEIVTPGADDDEIYTVWTRIRDGFKVPDMQNSVVEANVAKYSKRPDYLQRMADRSQKYLYHIIEEVDARGMPTEIALLPFVESAFVTNAKSRVKAAGLWQFMPATGRDYSLDQTMWLDKRYDVLKAHLRRLPIFRGFTTNSAPGRLRWQPTTGAKATCAARLSEIRRRVFRPTICR